MAQTVAEALRQGKFTTDDVLYSMIHLPSNAITAAAGIIAQLSEPFSTLIVDKDEVTLIIPTDAIEDFTSRLRDQQVSDTSYRLITFDLVLEPTLTGFMATVAGALAGANVPVMPLAAFSRDHILIPADRFDAAWLVLQQLQQNG